MTFVGCSSDDNNPRGQVPNDQVRSFVVQLENYEITHSSKVEIIFEGINEKNTDLWKVNGVLQENQPTIIITGKELTENKPIRLEAYQPLEAVNVKINISNKSDKKYYFKLSTQIKGDLESLYDGEIDTTATLIDTYKF